MDKPLNMLEGKTVKFKINIGFPDEEDEYIEKTGIVQSYHPARAPLGEFYIIKTKDSFEACAIPHIIEILK